MNWKLLIKDDARHLINLDTLKSDLGTSHGVIKKEDVLRAVPGEEIKTHIGKKFRIVEPCFNDLFRKMKRGPQIITLKDAAFISAMVGVKQNTRILDAGAGSGLLTSYLATQGAKVDSYDVREDFLKIAEYNARLFGVSENITFHKQDVYKKISAEDYYDVITLDVPEPWKALKQAEKALKHGGRLVAYVPTIKQVIKYCEDVDKKKFLHYDKTIEIFERGWKVTEKSVRPNTRMLGHTGFIVLTRKY